MMFAWAFAGSCALKGVRVGMYTAGVARERKATCLQCLGSEWTVACVLELSWWPSATPLSRLGLNVFRLGVCLLGGQPIHDTIPHTVGWSPVSDPPLPAGDDRIPCRAGLRPRAL
jgi:hypothetical protein